ncbi:hypothetical protein N657DRAFT_275459 [Parathielavia appendiculata]|uniref:Cytochrome b5 heme-binding domain-containing protein n=1 Tax=Parathielavia appendiculata TaxID=2587402 RepID=A0AAN6Z5V2_9PEZI|nr:hypothetical protein N657DRAFT_275459 [Parathielavia appendiculata]
MTDRMAANCGVSLGALSTTSPTSISARRLNGMPSSRWLPGKKPQAEALDAADVPNLLRRLALYKCGFLKQAAGLPPGDRPFTLRELGRYIYPEIGMYCAVGGVVLDLGRYLESHPGGSEILRQYAGRDPSMEFEQFHSDWRLTLEKHEHLRVGWIVHDMLDHRQNDIKHDEVVLLDRAYDIYNLTRDDSKEFSTPCCPTPAPTRLRR